MKLRIVLMSILLLSTGWPSPVDVDRMQTAVRIQERIMDTIVESDSLFSVHQRTDGVYISGFGAVFTVKIEYEESSSSFPALAPVPLLEGGVTPQSDELLRGLVVETQKKREMAAEHVAHVERMLGALREYLADYGPAMNLADTEAILLRAIFEGYRVLGDGQRTFKLMATETDLNGLRLGTIDRTTFIEDLVTVEEGDTVPMDIDVMGKILDTAFEPQTQRSSWAFFTDTPRSWATYIPGFGALFFHRHAGFNLTRVTIWRGAEPRVVRPGETETKDTPGEVKLIARLQSELRELIATYSPTVKSLKPGEQLLVAVKLSGRMSEGKGEMLIFRLNKGDIDRYEEPAELKEKIEVSWL